MKNPIRYCLMMLCVISTIGVKAQILNSYPTQVNAVIFLDFDGHTVTGTSWNTNGDIVCNPSGLDANGITEVFNRVAEDFRPFNINVTTDQAKYNAAPANRRIRVLITTSHEWYPVPGVGGVALLNSFTYGDNTPVFVFSAAHQFNIKNIAEAASHETGHSFGCRHQSEYNAACGKVSDYHWGIGSGEIGWAPIMGAGYERNMTLWHNGPNSLGCNNLQNDLSIITNLATNGFGYRTDDYNNDFLTASTTSFNSSMQFTVSGVVERTDDIDLIKFNLPQYGNFKLDAIPYNVGTGNSGSDLDLQIELFNSAMVSIGTYNPGTMLSSIIDTSIEGGNYYLRIDGKGNINASEYGSLGSYSLQGTLVSGVPLPLRRLELKGQINRNEHTLNWLIDADEAVIKQSIEVSVDGRSFTTLYDAPVTARTYTYAPTDQRPLRYRMNVTFDNHKQYYSNIITVRQGTIDRPKLIGNLITGTSLSVNSPAEYQYQVIDQQGRIINKGTVVKGFSSISTGTIASGMYMVRFANGQEQWVEKFVKN